MLIPHVLIKPRASSRWIPRVLIKRRELGRLVGDRGDSTPLATRGDPGLEELHVALRRA
jgi:hypothetical protein